MEENAVKPIASCIQNQPEGKAFKTWLSQRRQHFVFCPWIGDLLHRLYNRMIGQLIIKVLDSNTTTIQVGLERRQFASHKKKKSFEFEVNQPLRHRVLFRLFGIWRFSNECENEKRVYLKWVQLLNIRGRHNLATKGVSDSVVENWVGSGESRAVLCKAHINGGSGRFNG